MHLYFKIFHGNANNYLFEHILLIPTLDLFIIEINCKSLFSYFRVTLSTLGRHPNMLDVPRPTIKDRLHAQNI